MTASLSVPSVQAQDGCVPLALGSEDTLHRGHGVAEDVGLLLVFLLRLDDV